MNKELFPPVKFTPDEIKAMKEFVEKIKVDLSETDEETQTKFKAAQTRFKANEIKEIKEYSEKLKKPNLFETNEFSPEATQATNS